VEREFLYAEAEPFTPVFDAGADVPAALPE